MTGTICGVRPGDDRVTVKSPELYGITSLHGVRQVCPFEVRASAPGGSDARFNSPVTGPEKLGIRSLVEKDAHPATVSPAAKMTTIRFMISAH